MCRICFFLLYMTHTYLEEKTKMEFHDVNLFCQISITQRKLAISIVFHLIFWYFVNTKNVYVNDWPLDCLSSQYIYTYASLNGIQDRVLLNYFEIQRTHVIYKTKVHTLDVRATFNLIVSTFISKQIKRYQI